MPLEDFRSRLFLVMPQRMSSNEGDDFTAKFASALAGGDIACLLIDDEVTDERAFHATMQPYVETAQSTNIAVLIRNDTRMAGRLDVDGVHLNDAKTLDLDDQRALHERGLIVGCGGLNTRHKVLETGEREVDYLFFGRTDRPIEADTHPKTKTLSLWSAQMMAVPSVALAGASNEAFLELAEGGVEFIAVREQVWNAENPGEAVRQFNLTLDKVAQQRKEAAA
ncbi:MAG: thiamine phosphate synthase [Pseudomonadota bacterium]